MMIEINDSNFKETVLDSDKPVLADFWAEWCGPCRMLTPVLSELSKKYEDRLIIGKVNCDENPATPANYNISAIPCLILFKEGKEADRFVGFADINELSRFVEKNI
ncbi:MAG: thioredoxin [Armatimonadota bacterium]